MLKETIWSEDTIYSFCVGEQIQITNLSFEVIKAMLNEFLIVLLAILMQYEFAQVGQSQNFQNKSIIWRVVGQEEKR